MNGLQIDLTILIRKSILIEILTKSLNLYFLSCNMKGQFYWVILLQKQKISIKIILQEFCSPKLCFRSIAQHLIAYTKSYRKIKRPYAVSKPSLQEITHKKLHDYTNSMYKKVFLTFLTFYTYKIVVLSTTLSKMKHWQNQFQN